MKYKEKIKLAEYLKEIGATENQSILALKLHGIDKEEAKKLLRDDNKNK